MALSESLVARIGNVIAIYGPGDPVQVDEARARIALLGLQADEDYLDFVRRWGGCFVGIPVHAWGNSSSLGSETSTKLTLQARAEFGNTVDGLVFADDGSGNPIWIGSNGAIKTLDHDNGCVVRQIAANFAKLIELNLHDE